MKIVLASSSFGGGGITSYAHELINTYAEGNDFHVIIGSHSKAPITNTTVKIHAYDCQKYTVSNAIAILKLINEEIKPDLVIASFAPIINIIAPYLNDSIKVITVSHSLKYVESEYSAVNHPFIDTIIAASSIYNKEYLEQRFGIEDKEKIKLIYNFVKEYDGADVIREEKKKNEIINIVFPGAYNPSKAPEIVLQVVRELVKTDLQFKFMWIGKTNNRVSNYFKFLHIDDVRNLIKPDPRVVITGRVKTREEVETMIAHANIFFTPSRREGCPISLLEAMRVGAIAIVADFHNANMEIVKDGYNGFVIGRDDIKGFVTRITDIVKNHSDYYDVYENSYRTHVETLSYNCWKGKMDEALYHSESRHLNRKSSYNKMKIFFDCWRVKSMSIMSKIREVIEEKFLVLYKIYRLRNFY